MRRRKSGGALRSPSSRANSASSVTSRTIISPSACRRNPSAAAETRTASSGQSPISMSPADGDPLVAEVDEDPYPGSRLLRQSE